MTWTITGRSSGVLVGVTKYANPFVRAIGSHAPYFPSDPAGPAMRSDYTRIEEALRRLQTVQTDWRILSTDAVQNEIIDNVALLKSIEARSGKSITEISCIDRMGDSEPALSFNIALQPKAFHHVHELFSKLILSPNEIEYMISVGFLTFRFPGANTDTPTLDEFLSGRPYFSDEVSVSIRRARDNNA